MFSRYRKRLMSLTAPESLAGLDAMESFFRGGANWTQGAYNRSNGTKCLVGAANHVKESALDHAKVFVLQAVRERGYLTIEGFNDSRKSFAEIQDVLDRARFLAIEAHQAAIGSSSPVRGRLPAPAPDQVRGRLLAGEILPPDRDHERAEYPAHGSSPAPDQVRGRLLPAPDPVLVNVNPPRRALARRDWD
jgi:hypothetical protein